mgnify:CR=1 FL=1|jgi:hypothetical protein
MVDLFTKLPGFQKAPAGLERKILQLLPKVFLVGTTVIALPSLIARVWSVSDAPYLVAKMIKTVDIYTFSLLATLWTAMFTFAIGAFTVLVMKGPTYVADAYPLIDSDAPRPLEKLTEFNVNPLNVTERSR